MTARRLVPLLCLLVLCAAAASCRRNTAPGSARISPYRAVQRYTLEGPLTPIGLPIAIEQARIDLILRYASDASGELYLFRDDVWTLFGSVVGSWDGSSMSLFSEDGRGSAARFTVAFADTSVRGTAMIYLLSRGETVRYGVDLAYR